MNDRIDSPPMAAAVACLDMALLCLLLELKCSLLPPLLLSMVADTEVVGWVQVFGSVMWCVVRC